MRPGFQDLEEALEDENAVLTYKWVSLNFGVPVNEAKCLLKDFVERKRSADGDSLVVTFCLYGVPTTEGDRMTVVLAKESQRETILKKFAKVIGEHVYSVSKKLGSGVQALYNTDLDMIKQNIPVLNQYSAISSHAKYRENIDTQRAPSKTETSDNLVRETFGKKANGKSAPPPGALSADRKTSEAEIKPDEGEKSEAKTKIDERPQKPTLQPGKKLGGIASMFHKQQEKAANDKKEMKKSEMVEVKETKSEKATKRKSEERTSVPVRQSKSAGHLRRQKKADSDDEETPVPKRRKRVIVESDSSDSEPEARNMSEDEEEPLPPPPPVVAAASLPEPISSQSSSKGRRMKLVDKTFMDEDGFIVTRKEMEAVEESDEEEKTKKVEPVEEKRKVDVSPPKPQLKKKQASIVSFFKKN